MEIPFLDLKTQHRALKAEILALWSEILDSAGFIGGKYVEDFERGFAEACGASHCLAVNSGTDALRFILLALGLEAGDEVITVPNTFIATTEAISQAGGKVVFVDVDPATCNIDPRKLEAAVSPRTRGIIPVHLYGNPADMEAVQAIAERFGLWVVEDACQAHLAEYKGRRAGTIGRAAAFSFYPGKNLGACGEAGAVTTADPAIAAKVRLLRDHGQAQKYYHDLEGYNGRCDALQAAALSVKLSRLPGWCQRRREHASLYLDLLKDVPGITLPATTPGGLPVYHLFVIQVENRDNVMRRLQEKGIATALHYPVPLHLQKAYAHMNLPPGSFPVAEGCARRLLSLPIYPELTEKQIRYVCTTLKEVLKNDCAP